jgi:hypothetical protein
MEEQPLPPAPPVSDTFINVLSSPGQAFEGLHTKASAPSLWIVPLLVSVCLVAVILFVQFRISPFSEQMKETQRAAIHKMVEEGRIPRDQEDTILERSEGMGGIQLAIGLTVAVIAVAIFFFLGALFLWLTAKFALKAPVGYGKMLEFYGISSWIGVIGGIVTLMMMFALGSIHARPALSLAVLSSFDPFNTLHKYLASVEIFALWQTAVIGIALSRVSGKSIGVGLGAAFGLWIVYVVLRIALGIAG